MAISEPMKVMAVSMIAVSGSAAIENETLTLPAWNQLAAGAVMRSTVPPTSVANTQSATAHAPNTPSSTGQWLWFLSTFGPKKPATADPSRGRPGTSQSSGVSDIAVLGLAGGRPAGGRQRRHRLLGGRRRQGPRGGGRAPGRPPAGFPPGPRRGPPAPGGAPE